MKRTILLVLGGVLVVALGLAIYIYTTFGDLVREAIQTYGTEITQADVTLDEVDIDVGSGAGALRGFTIGNPAGFTSERAFRLGSVSIQFDAEQTSAEQVVLKHITVEQPDITYELTPEGNNIDTLKRNVDAYMARHAPAGEAAPEKQEKKPEVTVIVDDLYIRGGTVNVAASLLEGRKMTASLPDIHLQGIGRDSGGATPGELADKVMTALSQQVGKAVAGIGIGDSLDSLKDKLGSAAGDLQKSGGDAVKGSLDAAGEKMKGLLGN